MQTWDTPFDPEMLSGPLLVRVPDASAESELRQILEQHEIPCPFVNGSTWNEHREATVFRFKASVCAGFGSVEFYDRQRMYSGYARCTFYGASALLDDFVVDMDGTRLF